jgi:hypothetical protein
VTRAQLEHVIRAAAAIADVDELVVIGSQAILASYPDAPADLVRSMEADLYPAADPSRADLIDGAIGEESPFHEEFGYYAHGVGPETAVMPARWRNRAVTIRGGATGSARAVCPHPADLAASKLVASREKDRKYVRDLLFHGLVSRDELTRSVAELPVLHRAIATTALASIG